MDFGFIVDERLVMLLVLWLFVLLSSFWVCCICLDLVLWVCGFYAFVELVVLLFGLDLVWTFGVGFVFDFDFWVVFDFVDLQWCFCVLRTLVLEFVWVFISVVYGV